MGMTGLGRGLLVLLFGEPLFLGGGLVEWLLGQPPSIIALIVAALLAPWVLREVRQRRAAAAEPDPL